MVESEHLKQCRRCGEPIIFSYSQWMHVVEEGLVLYCADAPVAAPTDDQPVVEDQLESLWCSTCGHRPVRGLAVEGDNCLENPALCDGTYQTIVDKKERDD